MAAGKNLQLVLNLGSSSVKYALFKVSKAATAPSWNLLVQGLAEGIGTSKQARIKHETMDTGKVTHEVELPDHRVALKSAVALLSEEHVSAIGSVGHRVVHGGETFKNAAKVDASVIAAINEAVALAPLHNPWALLGIETVTDLFGAETPQVAVFDTAFHQTMPDYAYRYAIPKDLYEKHAIRKYGFHGTSYLYVTGEVAKVMGKPLNQTNIIACHIGNGASMCAIKGGQCIDTSMGLTPLEGLVMGTRCGDVDPALIPHLMQNLGYTVEQVSDMMNKKSGLLGLCGTMDDREVEQGFFDKDPVMSLAKNVQVHRMRKYLGAYMVALGGEVDAVVFTGGLGEKSHLLRSLVCENLARLGLEVDETRNQDKGGRFSENTPVHKEGTATQIWVIPTDEELSIAQQTYALVGGS